VRDVQQPAPFPEDDVGEIIAVGFELTGILSAGNLRIDFLDEIASPGRLHDRAVLPGSILHLLQMLFKVRDHPEEVRAEYKVVPAPQRFVVGAQPVFVDHVDVVA